MAANSNKSYMGAVLLSLLLGCIGVDRFYLGYVGTRILKLLTFGGFGIWYLIDLILIYSNNFKTKDGKALHGFPQDKNLATAFILVILISNILSGLYFMYTANNFYAALQEGITVQSEEGTASFKLGE